MGMESVGNYMSSGYSLMRRVAAIFVCSLLVGLVPSSVWCHIDSANQGFTTIEYNYITEDYSCSPGLSTPGTTYPKGDIILQNGSNLEMFCMLNPKRTDIRNASFLTFYYKDKEVPSEYLHIMNSTTIRLFIAEPPPSKSMYYCKLKADPENDLQEVPVCLNSVAIGFKPQKVENFTCVSMNWENLTCTWDVPVNYVKTVTSLQYSLPGRAGARFFYDCPNNTDLYEHKCFWDRSTAIVYRQPYDSYGFKMKVENQFGTRIDTYKFYHYGHVIPSPPSNYSILNKTSNSILIRWSKVFPMQNFPPGVICKVQYKSAWDSKDTWHVVNTSHLDLKGKTHVLNITDLKYSHTDYDIRIYMRSAVAVGDDKWSKPAALRVKTLPSVPGSPPKTDIGSFEVAALLPARDVYVYWQQIPEYLYNGDKFEYRVFNVDKNGVESLMVPDEINKAYARFKSLGLKDYHLKIYSFNEVGYSMTGSNLYIPTVQNMIVEPLTFTKIDFENGVYELSWKTPPDNSKIESYTIFWCDDNNRDRPYQCTGYLNWLRVEKNTFIKNITLPKKIYQFAISANSHSESSGMIWASCTVIHDKVVGKMKNVWINNIGSTYIELGWKLDCSDRVGVVKGFQIYYCPLASPGAEECKGGVESNKTILDDPPLTGYGNVTNLKPYTTYMLEVAILTKSGEGLRSSALFNTTMEDAPDPPRNLRVSELTNTSILVNWDPPTNMNGVLRNYKVHYGTSKPEPVESGFESKKLEKLDSFHYYNISVTACTTVCSEPSSPKLVRTLAGVPGMVDQPKINDMFVNDSQVLIRWNPPMMPRGNVEYYEIMLTQSVEKNNNSKIIIVTGTSAIVEMECNVEYVGQTLTYMVYVRGVNVRSEDNVTFTGPWSSPGVRSCYSAGLPPTVYIIIILFILLAVLALITGCTYSARRFWLYCRGMLDVGVKLPPELDSTIIEKGNADCLQRWSADKKDVNSQLDIFTPVPQQELLLLKKSESECDGDIDNESSGCSSAHESVISSSSHTSALHILDSGTEVDNRAESPEGEFLEPSPPLLRQRYVSTGRDGVRTRDAYVVIGNVNGTTASSSCSDNSNNTLSTNASETDAAFNGFLNRGTTGYCVVGNAPQPTSKGYISLGNNPSNSLKPPINSSGYVSHPPVWADHKDGVPQGAVVGPIPASKGYVVAGSLPMAQNSNKQPCKNYSRLGSKTDYITLPSTSTNSDK